MLRLLKLPLDEFSMFGRKCCFRVQLHLSRFLVRTGDDEKWNCRRTAQDNAQEVHQDESYCVPKCNVHVQFTQQLRWIPTKTRPIKAFTSPTEPRARQQTTAATPKAAHSSERRSGARKSESKKLLFTPIKSENTFLWGEKKCFLINCWWNLFGNSIPTNFSSLHDRY